MINMRIIDRETGNLIILTYVYKAMLSHREGGREGSIEGRIIPDQAVEHLLLSISNIICLSVLN